MRLRPHSADSTMLRLGRPVHLSGLLPLIATRWFSSSLSDPASRRTPCPPKIRRWRLQVSLSVSRLSPSCLTSLSIPFHHLRPMRHYPHLWISARGLGLSGTSTHLTRQLSGTHYGPLRPCAPLRYSRPRGWSRLRLVPSRHQRDEAQVLTFHTKAWSSFAPPTCRMPLGQYQGIPRADPGGGVTPPVLTSPNPLSTLLQRFACARLSRPCLPKSCPGVSATLTTSAFARSSLRWLEIGS